MNWIWLTEAEIIEVHADQLARYGGPSGVRDLGLLASAIGRPENKAAYGEPTIFELAAAYSYRIARNHPFIDGNKRTAFLAGAAFLGRNGYDVEAEEDEVIRTVLALAAGEMAEDALAEWFRSVTVAPGG